MKNPLSPLAIATLFALVAIAPMVMAGGTSNTKTPDAISTHSASSSVAIDGYPGSKYPVTADGYPGSKHPVTIDGYPGGKYPVTADGYPGGKYPINDFVA